jgi:hypothetical protein
MCGAPAPTLSPKEGDKGGAPQVKTHGEKLGHPRRELPPQRPVGERRPVARPPAVLATRLIFDNVSTPLQPHAIIPPQSQRQTTGLKPSGLQARNGLSVSRPDILPPRV